MRRLAIKEFFSGSGLDGVFRGPLTDGLEVPLDVAGGLVGVCSPTSARPFSGGGEEGWADVRHGSFFPRLEGSRIMAWLLD